MVSKSGFQDIPRISYDLFGIDFKNEYMICIKCEATYLLVQAFSKSQRRSG